MYRKVHIVSFHSCSCSTTVFDAEPQALAILTVFPILHGICRMFRGARRSLFVKVFRVPLRLPRDRRRAAHVAQTTSHTNHVLRERGVHLHTMHES